MTDVADAQASLEATLKDEIIRMYEEVAEHPDGEFHFFHGREAADLFEYAPEWLDRAPAAAVASFAGVGNPHLRSKLQPGETVLDLGSGAGLDSIIASWGVGATGRVIGVDLNPGMCRKAQANVAATGAQMECHEGRMENIPLPDASVDVILFKRRDQSVVPQASSGRGNVSRAPTRRSDLHRGHCQRQAAVPVDRE